MSKILNFLSTHTFFKAQDAPKPVSGCGSAPDPAAGAYDTPQTPLVGWGGVHPRPHCLPLDASASRSRRLWRLASDPLVLFG